MQYNILGKTGFKASKLCFGSLTLGPLQKNFSVTEGANLIVEAYKRGVNIIDTAELYDTYKYVGEALNQIPREKYFIIAKSYAYDEKTAIYSLEKALDELKTDYVDAFMLHEQESEHTLRGHKEAIDYFLKQKKIGRVKNFGISTHYVRAVNACLDLDFIDLIHPLMNIDSIGIQDGNINDMINAVKKAKMKNIGIYSMKALGGGNLISKYDDAIKFINNLDCVDSIAIGMQSIDEIEANILALENKKIPEEISNRIRNKNRILKIDNWCIGCGKCAQMCKYNAISIINGKAVVDHKKCLVCSYCAGYCSEFCIKVI